MCSSLVKYIKQYINIIITDFVLTLRVDFTWNHFGLDLCISPSRITCAIHFIRCTWCLCHVSVTVMQQSQISPAAWRQWVFLLQLSGVFFCRMYSVGFFFFCISGFFFFCSSVGFSSVAQWVFFGKMCLVGFSSAAQWVFLLQDVLSGFFFCSLVGFSSAGCAPWVYALTKAVICRFWWIVRTVTRDTTRDVHVAV